MCTEPAEISRKSVRTEKPAWASRMHRSSREPKTRSTWIIQFGQEPEQEYGTAGRSLSQGDRSMADLFGELYGGVLTGAGGSTRNSYGRAELVGSLRKAG